MIGDVDGTCKRSLKHQKKTMETRKISESDETNTYDERKFISFVGYVCTETQRIRCFRSDGFKCGDISISKDKKLNHDFSVYSQLERIKGVTALYLSSGSSAPVEDRSLLNNRWQFNLCSGSINVVLKRNRQDAFNYLMSFSAVTLISLTFSRHGIRKKNSVSNFLTSTKKSNYYRLM